jgi:hypothetical protein
MGKADQNKSGDGNAPSFSYRGYLATVNLHARAWCASGSS